MKPQDDGWTYGLFGIILEWVFNKVWIWERKGGRKNRVVINMSGWMSDKEEDYMAAVPF